MPSPSRRRRLNMEALGPNDVIPETADGTAEIYKTGKLSPNGWALFKERMEVYLAAAPPVREDVSTPALNWADGKYEYNPFQNLDSRLVFAGITNLIMHQLAPMDLVAWADYFNMPFPGQVPGPKGTKIFLGKDAACQFVWITETSDWEAVFNASVSLRSPSTMWDYAPGDAAVPGLWKVVHEDLAAVYAAITSFDYFDDDLPICFLGHGYGAALAVGSAIYYKKGNPTKDVTEVFAFGAPLYTSQAIWPTIIGQGLVINDVFNSADIFRDFPYISNRFFAEGRRMDYFTEPPPGHQIGSQGYYTPAHYWVITNYKPKFLQKNIRWGDEENSLARIGDPVHFYATTSELPDSESSFDLPPSSSQANTPSTIFTDQNSEPLNIRQACHSPKIYAQALIKMKAAYSNVPVALYRAGNWYGGMSTASPTFAPFPSAPVDVTYQYRGR